MAAERWNRLHPTATSRDARSSRSRSAGRTGPVVAATDYIRALPDEIRPWVDAPYTVLGTDGFGRSDYREALRRFFEVDRHHVVVAALHALGRDKDAEGRDQASTASTPTRRPHGGGEAGRRSPTSGTSPTSR